MSGYFFVHRGVFDHELFANEPFTEREAWLWLISEAAWQEKKIRTGRHVIQLKRGQLAHAHRYMAAVWKWHPSKVYRFLILLRKHQQIETLANSETHLITICNYDKYQLSRNAGETQIETLAKHSRNKEEERKEDKNSSVVEGDLWQQAQGLADELACVCKHDLKALPLAWHGSATSVLKWLKHGVSPRTILDAARVMAANKRDGPPESARYFEKGILRAHALENAPLPDVKIIPAETLEVRRAQRLQGSITDAANRAVRYFEEGGREGGEAVTGLLPDGRSE